MPTVIPFIPNTITVHLGAPDDPAPNVTVAFPDYIKNVVSSEIYPTWAPSAIRANTLAIISYALNRIYTEFYPSRGYDFNITNTTAFDQRYIQGRNIYENISQLVDEIFNNYIRRKNFVEPLAARFCNGTTVTCSGLSQWGSQYQALAGANSVEILRSYYGEDIELVVNAPTGELRGSYPGTPLQLGSVGASVLVIQTSLNRISQNYPAIPKIQINGVFDQPTRQAVLAFQSIFLLDTDGIVGPATWHQLVQIYVAVTELTELQSQGQQYYGFAFQYPDVLQEGDRGVGIPLLQFQLAVLGEFLTAVPQIEQTGVFDRDTRLAVEAFQAYANLPVTGVVDEATWVALQAQYSSINETVFQNRLLFPYDSSAAATAARTYQNTTRFLQYPGVVLQEGMQDQEVGL